LASAHGQGLLEWAHFLSYKCRENAKKKEILEFYSHERMLGVALPRRKVSYSSDVYAFPGISDESRDD